jgi:hypothetical protein
MNKVIIGVIIAGIVVIGGVAVFLNVTRNSGNVSVTTSDSNSSFVVIGACDILTKDIVEQTLGGVVPTAKPAEGTSTNADISISTCSYNVVNGSGSKARTTGSALLMARSARNSFGAEMNKADFDKSRVEDAETVEGIGDKAYYSKLFNQLNILKGHNWYTIATYKGSSDQGTLAGARELAEKLNLQ